MQHNVILHVSLHCKSPLTCTFNKNIHNIVSYYVKLLNPHVVINTISFQHAISQYYIVYQLYMYVAYVYSETFLTTFTFIQRHLVR